MGLRPLFSTLVNRSRTTVNTCWTTSTSRTAKRYGKIFRTDIPILSLPVVVALLPPNRHSIQHGPTHNLHETKGQTMPSQALPLHLSIQVQPPTEADSDNLNDGTTYQTVNRNTSNRAPYQNRQFIAVDGEGVNHDVDSAQSYVLLGTSSGESVSSRDLSTIECLEFLMHVRDRHPHALFVAFAFNYDVNMILKDVPIHLLHRMRKAKPTKWGGYRIHYIPSKWFAVTNLHTGHTMKVFDTFTFFACSFLVACEQFLGKDDERLIRVRDGKGKRNVFRYDELHSLIKPYMREELSLMVSLVETLRTSLETAGIFPRSWHGPGAIASALLKREHIKDYKTPDLPPTVRLASQFAYYGGRFEQFKTGMYEGEVHYYDINSAYPYALTLCPSLTGEWHEREFPSDRNPFKLYHVRYVPDLRPPKFDIRSINPIPLRDNKHCVYYPPLVDTWIWGPEYEIMRKHFDGSMQLVSVIEIDDDGTRPFEFIQDMFLERKEFKRQGNPAQLACKLGMNSVYGKLAQRVGWNEEKGTAPPFHQLEWAGFLTSVCRAKMLDVMMQAPSSIIAIETDGLFSTQQLDVTIGDQLGEFEHEEYDGIIYVQSGVYFKRQNHKWLAGKTRGFANNTLSPSDAMRSVTNLEPLTTTQNRFGGMAMHAGKSTWRRFNETEQALQWGGAGKRYHSRKYCDACLLGDGSGWHDTVCRLPGMVKSHPHTLPWVDGDINPWQEREEWFDNV